MSDVNVEIPGVFENRGPQPDGVVFTFVGEEAGNPGALVACGTNERTCKLADASDIAIGWAQSAMEADKEVDIHLVNAVWKSDVDAGSSAISYGDILAQADDGKVKKAPGDTASQVVGIALSAASASGQVIYVPMMTVPDPITT